jgi:glycosyltransferase involved in cell wall biosynthesis
MGVTVAICCHNSATRIRPTLEHLLAQAGAVPHSWEVLLVDNASNDDTVAAAKNVWTSKDVPLRIATESQPGLMHARKCAFREAAFEYVAFVDDDNWVCPRWVSEVARIMDANPGIGALGARSEPAFEISPPPWFEGFQGCYAVGQQWPEAGDVTVGRGFLWGAGLTIRKTAWQQILALGFHSQLEGRRGSVLTAGEDNEICQALRLAGWRLYFEPKLSFRHFIPAQRLKWDYLRKIVANFGASSILLDVYQWCYSDAKAPWHRRFSGHWLHPAVSAIKALITRPVAAARVLCGCGVGHPAAYYVYFHCGRLQGALRMRGRYDAACRSITQCAQSLTRGGRNTPQNSGAAAKLAGTAVGNFELPSKIS